MEQNAGHLTMYRNLRSVVEQTAPPDILPAWHELHYYRAGGRLERLRQRHQRLIPGYMTGNTRMLLEFHRGSDGTDLRCHPDQLLGGHVLRQTDLAFPTVMVFDSTPLQIDRMPAYEGPRDAAPVAEIKYRLCRRAYRSAHRLQAWSNWAKDSAVNEYGVPAHKVVVNPPGVDLDFFRPAEEGRQGDNGKLRVVFVGGDFRRKGGDLLLEWFRHQNVGDVELHLATREAVSGLPGVVVHDVTPNSARLLELYRQGDVFVLPSLAECFGIATVEAMATGLPVVVSDAGGTADIVEHGHNGFVTKAGDIGQLSSALTTVLSNPTLRRSMGARSRQLAVKSFDAKRNALRTLDILRDLAAGQGRAEKW